MPRPGLRQAINLALLILFPVAWFAPLLRAGLLPLFGLGFAFFLPGAVPAVVTAGLMGLLTPLLVPVSEATMHLPMIVAGFGCRAGASAAALQMRLGRIRTLRTRNRSVYGARA